MAKQVMVLGLGQFGMTLARTLTEREVEVLAVDVREERVNVAAAFVEEALCFDATDEQALARTSPQRRDVVVCAIGDEAREASIICTALLRQMGAPRVIARSNNDVHARILSMVGAHEVVNPEREYGERFASRLIYSHVLGEMPLGGELVISELTVPAAMVGRHLRELRLRQRFGITVVALRRGEDAKIQIPEPEEPFQAGDVAVVVGSSESVSDLLERM